MKEAPTKGATSTGRGQLTSTAAPEALAAREDAAQSEATNKVGVGGFPVPPA